MDLKSALSRPKQYHHGGGVVGRQPPFFMAENKRKSDIVIIGGVACGPKTAATLARRKAELSITVYQKEKDISYGSCGLPYFASGDIESFEALTKTSYDVPRSVEFFKNSKGFEVVTEAEVIAIDRNKKTVTVKMLATDETIIHEYDSLVIATGADPARPPFPCAESPKIRPFTRPGDALSFRKLAETGQVGKAVIIGGGFIGCELAEAMGSLWGIETVLVERENQLLPYILDPEMAAVAERELARQDVEVITGAAVEKIELDGEGNPVVHITGHDPVTADFAFLCLGVRPNVKLAKDCGLDIGSFGGIVVDENLKSSDTDIYAGGDCIESQNRITGNKCYIPMGSLANRHGWVIAENIIGNPVKFPGVVGSFLVKMFDLNVGSAGLSETAAQKAGMKAKSIWGSFGDKPDYYPESKVMALKLVYDAESKRILGLQAAGTGDICRRVDVVSVMIQNEATLDDLIDFEHGYAPPYAEALDPLHHLAAMAMAEAKGYAFVGPGTVLPDVEGVVWLDVREPAEAEAQPWPFPEGTNPVNIPLNDLRDRLDELDKMSDIRLVCKRGPRSYQAAVILRQAGFEKVRIFAGGYQAAWA